MRFFTLFAAFALLWTSVFAAWPQSGRLQRRSLDRRSGSVILARRGFQARSYLTRRSQDSDKVDAAAYHAHEKAHQAHTDAAQMHADAAREHKAAELAHHGPGGDPTKALHHYNTYAEHLLKSEEHRTQAEAHSDVLRSPGPLNNHHLEQGDLSHLHAVASKNRASMSRDSAQRSIEKISTH